MSAHGLDTDDEGLIVVHPVVGWTSFTAFGTACGLRIEYVRSMDQFEKSEAVQLVLTPDQAIELAQALMDKAARTLRPPETGAARN